MVFLSNRESEESKKGFAEYCDEYDGRLGMYCIVIFRLCLP